MWDQSFSELSLNQSILSRGTDAIPDLPLAIQNLAPISIHLLITEGPEGH